MPMNMRMIDNIRQYFTTQPVKKAWLFGSFSRGEETAESDVDILVEFDRTGKPVTLLTYARIWRELEERLGRSVDLVEEGTLKPYAVESANHDKQLIYERKLRTTTDFCISRNPETMFLNSRKYASEQREKPMPTGVFFHCCT